MNTFTTSNGTLYAGTNEGVWSYYPLPNLTTVTITGTVPALTVGGNGFNLSKLTISGQDQYGNSYDISSMPVTWSVASGSQYASINTGTTTLNPVAAGSGTIVATVDGVTSNTINFTVNPATVSSPGGGGGGGPVATPQPVNSSTGSATVTPSIGGTISLVTALQHPLLR